jgi:ABC-type Fe3+ transport system substrate-binding protein
MLRLLPILLLALIIALPFALRPEIQSTTDWKPGDPTLVIVTPHNEAIRYEFEQAFSRWHQTHYKQPVKIDWRSVGGTTEIMRFLASEYAAAARTWWSRTHKKDWPANATDALTATTPPTDPHLLDLWETFRKTDNPQTLTARIDVFFGGGEFDHSTAYRQGLTVHPWKQGEEPEHLFYLPLPPDERRAETHEGIGDEARVVGQRIQIAPRAAPSTRSRPSAAPPTRPIASRPSAAPPTRPSASTRPPQPQPTIPDPIPLIPERLSGETWRTPYLVGNVISTFGLCYNHDRLKELNISSPPTTWDDLANPAYFQQVGAADPTKSGSVAKAFEMIIHQKIYQSVRLAGFTDPQIAAHEKSIDAHINSKGKHYQRGDVPPELQKYQDAIEQGWLDGLRLIQLIGANARYFTDSSQKVPIDVSVGDAAVGMSIDFYARYQAQTSRAKGGADRMTYITPRGGSSVSCDPISLLRGAPSRELAVRFIEFTLSEEGQKLWCYKPVSAGEPASAGGPEKYYLRRLPIRRDFYPSTNPTIQKRHEQHLKHSADNLADPQINPYALAETFTYNPRWTASHFSIQRELVKVLAMDSGDELKEAWQAIIKNGGPANNPKALQKLHDLPTITLSGNEIKINWRTAPDLRRKHEPMDLTREWTKAFRQNYREAKQFALSK